WTGKKVDSARALIARGWGVSLVSRCLRVSRAQLYVILRRTDDWMDGRRSRHPDERLRVTFALDCCDREALHWAVTTGGFNSETVQD
ncbi:IS3 family transposase, partial [Escherichia coli]